MDRALQVGVAAAFHSFLITVFELAVLCFSFSMASILISVPAFFFVFLNEALYFTFNLYGISIFACTSPPQPLLTLIQCFFVQMLASLFLVFAFLFLLQFVFVYICLCVLNLLLVQLLLDEVHFLHVFLAVFLSGGGVSVRVSQNFSHLGIVKVVTKLFFYAVYFNLLQNVSFGLSLFFSSVLLLFQLPRLMLPSCVFDQLVHFSFYFFNFPREAAAYYFICWLVSRIKMGLAL